MQLQFDPPIKALILDMDGVLWKDSEALVDLPAAFDRMQKLGLKVILATNNGTRTPYQYVEKLAGFGVSIQAEQVLTSAMGIAHLMSQRFPQGGPVYIIGEQGLRSVLEEHGFRHAEQDVIAVVAGLDRKLTFDMLKRATLLIRSGVPFFFTNPDRTFPTPEGLIPGAGSILAFLEATTDVKPTIAGKPFPYLYNFALERLGILPQEALAVGDRLDTDILGGQRAGCRTALVLSGVSTREEAERWELQPNLIASDLMELLA